MLRQSEVGIPAVRRRPYHRKLLPLSIYPAFMHLIHPTSLHQLAALGHDDYIPRSLALLRKGGRFMEIGKRGIWSHEQMFEARPDVMYEKIAADTMMDKAGELCT